jgi:hypothetical protein
MKSPNFEVALQPDHCRCGVDPKFLFILTMSSVNVHHCKSSSSTIPRHYHVSNLCSTKPDHCVQFSLQKSRGLLVVPLFLLVSSPSSRIVLLRSSDFFYSSFFLLQAAACASCELKSFFPSAENVKKIGENTSVRRNSCVVRLRRPLRV